MIDSDLNFFDTLRINMQRWKFDKRIITCTLFWKLFVLYKVISQQTPQGKRYKIIENFNMKQKSFDILVVLWKSTERVKPSFICCRSWIQNIKKKEKAFTLKAICFLKDNSTKIPMTCHERTFTFMSTNTPIFSLNIRHTKRRRR